MNDAVSISTLVKALAALLVGTFLIPTSLLARENRESRDGSTERAAVPLQDAAQSSPIDVTNVTNEGNQNSNSTSVTTTVEVMGSK